MFWNRGTVVEIRRECGLDIGGIQFKVGDEDIA